MSDKNKAITLSKMYSIAQGIVAPVPGMSAAKALSRLYSLARVGNKLSAGKYKDSDTALATSKKKKAAFLKEKLSDKKTGGRAAKKKK